MLHVYRMILILMIVILIYMICNRKKREFRKNCDDGTLMTGDLYVLRCAAPEKFKLEV